MTAERLAAVAAVSLLLALLPRGASADERHVCSEAAEAAQSHRTAGKLAIAKKELVRCAQESCPKVVRETCTGWLGEVDAELPSLVLRAVDGSGNDVVDARVTSNGAPLAGRLDGKPLTLDPEVLHLRFEADGFAPKEVTVVVARGEKRRVVSVKLERIGAAAPPPPPKPSGSIAPWIFVGTGVASLAAFAITEGIAQSEYSGLKADPCAKLQTCDTGPVSAKFVASAIFLGVGVAAVGTGVAWWIVASPSSASSKSGGAASVRLGLRPAGALLDVRF